MLLIGAMPRGKILLGDAFHDLDAQLVDDRASAAFNVKKGTDEAANISCNFYDAVDILNFFQAPQPLSWPLFCGCRTCQEIAHSGCSPRSYATLST